MGIIDWILMFVLCILIGVLEIQTYLRERGKIKESKGISGLDEFCNKHYKKIWLLFAIIFLVTVVYKFGELPTYISVDEAGGIYDAISIGNDGVDRYLNSFPVYLPNFGGGQSVLCCYLTTLCIKLFGSNMISYRLPFLFMYVVAIFSSYLLITQSKNKKTALFYTFLIITCPWNITSARHALDCNLYAGMLMLDLFLMNRAKKNYQYILAGISVGITLYTYCLSWITMPLFLAIWAIYMLYIKKIKLRQLIIFAIPIAIFAAPLIYFLLVNFGIAHQTQFGIFTVPKLREFRNGEIKLSNIWERGLVSLKVIFIQGNTIYRMFVPLFVIGYILAIKESIKSIKQRKYDITTVMVIAFTTIFIGLLFASVPTPNKANALYIPMLYFITISILEMFKNSKTLFIINLILICIAFMNFEYRYYTNEAYKINSRIYDDNSFHKLVKKLEENEETANMVKRIFIIKTEPTIYQLLATEMSAYQYNENMEKEEDGKSVRITRVGNYYYYNLVYHLERFFDEAFKNPNELIIVTSDFLVILYNHGVDLEQYQKVEYEDLSILLNKSSNLQLENIINNH